MIKNSFKQTAIVATTALATLAFSSSANAATVFNFNGSNAIQSSFTFTEDDLTVTATGSTVGVTPSQVSRTVAGLGVVSAADTNNQIDAFGPDETLSLFFNQQVRLVSAVFGSVDASADGDDFLLLVNGVDFFGGGVNIPNTGSRVSFDFSPIPGPAQNFAFTVGSGLAAGGDDYALRSLTVEVVPTPALLPGLVGMGFAALRKRRQLSTNA